MNRLFSSNARKNIFDLTALEIKRDLSYKRINNLINQVFNLTTKNFRTNFKNDLGKSNLLMSITRRNFAENNDKKHYNPFKNKNKLKNEDYFKNDTDYLKRVVIVEEIITPEDSKEESSSNEKKEREKQVILNIDKSQESKIEEQKPDENLKKVIKETSNKNLSDYIAEEKQDSAQEKYKEPDSDYFKQKEYYTRSQVYGIKNKIEKASKSDPEWGLNLNRKFLQRNFLKNKNIFYDFEKESLDERKINYDFLKTIKLEEPITIYECFIPSLKPMISAKRHAITYAVMIPYIYLMFFFNWEFLFSPKYTQNFAHIITNAVFIGFVYNYKLMRYYNKTLVTQIKYCGKEDSVLFFIHRGFNNGILEVKHKVQDLYAFKSDSWLISNNIYVKTVTDPKILYVVPVSGIFHEREAFENIFDVIINETEYDTKKKKEKFEEKNLDPESQEKSKENNEDGETLKNNEKFTFDEQLEKKKY